MSHKAGYGEGHGNSATNVSLNSSRLLLALFRPALFLLKIEILLKKGSSNLRKYIKESVFNLTLCITHQTSPCV